jgi:chromosome segregation ATPase
MANSQLMLKKEDEARRIAGQNAREETPMAQDVKQDINLDISQDINPAELLPDSGLFSDIRIKSQKIINLNFDMAQRLSWNEDAIADLNQDLQSLQDRLGRFEEFRKKASLLAAKLGKLALMNAALRQDIEILKNDLDERDRYISFLKREVTKRHPLSEAYRQQRAEAAAMKEKIRSLQGNISILQQDISEKDNFLSFMRRTSVKKQAMLLKRELSARDEKIRQLSSELAALKSNNSELSASSKEFRGADAEEFNVLKSKLDSYQKEKDRLAEELERKNAMNDRLGLLIKDSAKSMISTGKELEGLKAENKRMHQLAGELGKAKAANKALAMALAEMKSGLSVREKEQAELGVRLKEKSSDFLRLKEESAKLEADLKVSEHANMLLVRGMKKISEELKHARQDSRQIEADYKAKLKQAMQDSSSAAKEDKEIMKKIIAEMLKKDASLESENNGFRKKIEALSQQHDDFSAKEKFYKQVILKMTENELSLKSELEALRKRAGKLPRMP